MGYTTEFNGQFKITPALSDELIQELNEFCDTRHERSDAPGSVGAWGDDLNRPYDGSLANTTSIGIWCDWEFTAADGYTVMTWNGNEKSYDMVEWARFIIANHLPASARVTGVIGAHGEDSYDVWQMVATGREVERRNGTVVFG